MLEGINSRRYVFISNSFMTEPYYIETSQFICSANNFDHIEPIDRVFVVESEIILSCLVRSMFDIITPKMLAKFLNICEKGKSFPQLEYFNSIFIKMKKINISHGFYLQL